MQELKTDLFKLRSFRNEDAEAFHLAINTQSIARDTTIIIPWSLDNIRWWIGFINDAAAKRPLTEQHFIIEIEGELAGSIGIINIEGHKCEIGYWLKDQYSGRGIMTKIVGLVSDYIFINLRLKRIFAPVLTHNKASVKLLENNGFLMEGVLKSFYFKDGKYIDALCYAKV